MQKIPEPQGFRLRRGPNQAIVRDRRATGRLVLFMDRQLQNRAQGALMGALVGDALALGPHWYYDLDAMRHDYGEWITDFTDPKPNRYHGGLRAGDLSQAGHLLRLTAQSIVDSAGYDEADFCRRFDQDFFPLLDGSPFNGPGGYTSQSIREAWHKRTREGRPWGECAGLADTTEAIERTIAIGVRYATDPRSLATHVANNTSLTQRDDTVLSITVAFNAALGLLIEGHRFDDRLSSKLMGRVQKGLLPFHKDYGPNPSPTAIAGNFASPDALLTASHIAEAASDTDIRIEPAWKVSLVYGMPCAVYHQVPSAYYLAARFSDDFESAILHAVNGGGQNLARAMLTGALVGAQVGLSGIPSRFIEGISGSQSLLDMAERLASDASR